MLLSLFHTWVLSHLPQAGLLQADPQPPLPAFLSHQFFLIHNLLTATVYTRSLWAPLGTHHCPPGCSKPPCTHRHREHHLAHTNVRQAESPGAACPQAAMPSEFLILLLQMLQFHVLVLGVSTIPSALVREWQPHPPLISGQSSIKACPLELSACLWEGEAIAEVIMLCRCYCSLRKICLNVCACF